MTEKELRTAYDKMSLSEERLSELEKRFAASVKPGNQDSSSETYADAFMNFDHEYRPEPKKKKPLRTALISTAAAAAVIAVGVTAAFRTGLIPVQPAESVLQTSEASADDTLIADDLPQYENKDINRGEVTLDNDYSERAQLDSQNGNIYRTQLVAEFMVTNCFGAIDENFSAYEVRVDECFFNLTGIEQQGRSINFVARGTESNQSVGCPVYSIGDRILAALYCTDGEYRLSAEFALSDIINVNGKDCAAVRSSVLAALPIANYPIGNNSDGDAVEYPTTTNVNPAKYYGFYDPQALAEYLVQKAEYAQKIKQPLQGTFDMSELDFRTDKEAMKIFESWFIGSWLQYSADEQKIINMENLRYYSYDSVFSLSPEGMTCGGFAANADNTAFFMLRGESKSDYNSLWVVMKDAPDRMYVYDHSEYDLRSFAEYSSHYWDNNGRVQEELGQSTISRLGIMKFLAEADDPALSEAVYGLFENAEADFAGKHWKRVPVSADSFGDTINYGEDNRLDITDPEHPVIYVDLYDAETPWKSLEPGGEYKGIIKRTFIAEFSESGGKWTYTLTPQSGDINDIENFWSPLKNYGFYPVQDWNGGESIDDIPESDIELEYCLVPRTARNELYVVRRYSSPECQCEDLYWWNQQFDRCEFIDRAEHISAMENSGSLIVTARFDNETLIYEYVQKSCRNVELSDYTDTDPEICFRGKYMIITKHDPSNGTMWLVTDRQTWERADSYADSEFTLTDDGFITNKDGKSIVYTSASDDIESVLLSLDCHARDLWFNFEVNAPDWTGNSFEVDANGITRSIAEIENQDWRTRDSLLAEFRKVYTYEAAQEALWSVTGLSVIEYNGRMYSMMGGRGTDLEIYEVIPEVTWENPERTQAEITYKVSYYDDGHTGASGLTSAYTINAYKEPDGWKLDRFYYPY